MKKYWEWSHISANAKEKFSILGVGGTVQNCAVHLQNMVLNAAGKLQTIGGMGLTECLEFFFQGLPKRGKKRQNSSYITS